MRSEGNNSGDFSGAPKPGILEESAREQHQPGVALSLNQSDLHAARND
jgi:hypothetical protein